MAEISKLKQGTTVYDIKDASAVHSVDTVLSSTSTNPVQNKVIKAALDKKGTLISLSTATATALLDYYSFDVSAADITAINAAHDGVIISFDSSSAFGANETFVGFLNETTLWNGITYLAYSGTISAATSLDSNLFVLLLPTTGNGGTGYIKAKNVATTGDVADAIEALDAAVSGLGTDKTITALLETNGVISAEASDIAIAGKQVEGGATQYYGTCATAAGTAAKVVTCTGFVLVAGARISVRFTNGSTSTSTMQLNVNSTGAKNCGAYLYNGSWQTCANRCEKNEVLEFMYDGTYWVTLTPYTLRNFGNYSARLTSANISLPNGGLQYFLATSAMTTGKPPTDAAILNMNWDNGTIWGMQLAVGNGTGRVFTRAQNGSATWGDWKELPRLSSTPTDGQIIVYDAQSGNGMLKGGPALDTNDTTKFLRHDGSWAEIGGGVAPVEDTDVFLSRAVNFGENKYKFPSLVGGTVAWNQLFKPRTTNFTINGVNITVSDGKFTASGTATANGGRNVLWNDTDTNIEFIQNHKYFVTTPAPLQVTNHASASSVVNVFYGGSKIYNWTGASVVCHLGWNSTNGTTYSWSGYVWIVDLTLALGPTIADYIYSLEQATTGAGVNWFKQYFPKSYYPYNARALVSVNPTGAETTGVNQWDEAVEAGNLDANGLPATGSNAIRSKNYCRCLPNTAYYVCSSKTDGGTSNKFYLKICWYDANKNYISGSWENNRTITSPSSAAFFKICTNTSTAVYGTTYNHDICINISNPLYNGTYYPYTHHSYPISPVELRGIPKLSDGKLAFDGDVRASDGTVTRKYGIVDLGTLSWSYGNNSGSWPHSLFYVSVTGKATNSNRNIICPKYIVSEYGVSSSNLQDKSITVSSNAYLYVRDDAYTTAANFKTAMSGVYLVYELATPTTESSATLPVPQVVYDGGIESYIDERDVQMPVGQDATYMDATSAIGELMDSGLVPSSGGGGSSESEGTFTVTDGVGSSDTWSYYKIGKQVTVSGKYTGSSTALSLKGLPFIVKFKQVFFLPVQITSPTIQLYSCQVTLTANATTIGTYGYGSSPTSSWLSFAKTAGTQITFSYITDD